MPVLFLSAVVSMHTHVSNIVFYIKVFIIRPDRSRLLEFEKKIVCTGCLIKTFFKYPDQVV